MSGGECSFCEADRCGQSVAYFDDVAEYIKDCLYREYSLAVEELGYDGREGGYEGKGGYIGVHWDCDEFLYDVIELDLPNDYNSRLLYTIVDFLGGEPWCERDPYGLNDDESARYSWEVFSRTVKYERRYFFTDFGRDPYNYDRDTPGEVLDKIFQYAQDIDLVKPIPEGTPMFRARRQDSDSCFKTPEELGPPPREKANQSNRMSAPGIVMFYAGDEAETALLETAQAPGKFAVGKFETLRPARVLDLMNIPPLPSLFEPISDSLEYSPRTVLKFLHHVSEQMSRPIARDDRIHIEYVPTQVVTEFIRSQVTVDGSKIDGIMYESSVRVGHISYVLFATQDNLVLDEGDTSDGDRWIKLIEASCHTVTLKHG